MTVAVETLEKLERKLTFGLSQAEIAQEVNARLLKLARTVKMDGFRPGKVPLRVVSQRYGASVHYEVIEEQVGRKFFATALEAGLRVAGQPEIQEADTKTEGQLCFAARFEVFPDVQIGALSGLQIEKTLAEVSPEAVDKTIEILRKQRRSFALRSVDAAVQDGDQVTCDFEGKIDGEPFAGGKAEGFSFVLGEGKMLPEFEQAVLGMKVSESKTFQVPFPADYHGREVAGKTADFLLTLKRIESAHLPELDEALAQSLGITEGGVEGLRADITRNLQREVKQRLSARNKKAAFDALLTLATFDVPKVLVQDQAERQVQGAREELKQRGFKEADKLDLPADMFREQAERSVRLGLAISHLIGEHKLSASPEQVNAAIQEMASSYEHPEDVVRWYHSDAQRMDNVRGVVVENSLVDLIFAQAQVSEKTLSFEDLMGQSAQG